MPGRIDVDSVANFYMKHIFKEKDQRLINELDGCIGFLDHFKDSELEYV